MTDYLDGAHVCIECGKRFKTVLSFRRHLSKHLNRTYKGKGKDEATAGKKGGVCSGGNKRTTK